MFSTIEQGKKIQLRATKMIDGTITMPKALTGIKRRRFSVIGTVQGVGFRPFVFRLAEQHGLTGFVLNAGGAVIIEAEGDEHALDDFACALEQEAPPLSKIDASTCETLTPRHDERSFVILASGDGLDFAKSIPPDSATCEGCLRELFDPADRRFRYPFINCTNCGPRFTIIESFPYDRARTAMAEFIMCAACAEEYANPAHRRFHAQPNACAVCGPQLQFVADGAVVAKGTEAALEKTVALLKSGGIAAIKGLGGFHLSCDATNSDAVQLLRHRKKRDEKPLAVMYARLPDVEADCLLPAGARSALTSHRRPIVLCRQKSNCSLSAGVSPGLDKIGVMLPYTPLHHILLDQCGGPLVMTSGNISEEPICIGNQEAIARLAPLCDGFLLHDREIAARYDDSVVIAEESGHTYPLRRSRGYAPEPITLAAETKQSVLAMGAHLKNTFCILSGNKAYVSQHIGDLDNLDAVEHFERSLERFLQLFELKPQLIACDLHPDYMSTSLAQEWGRKLQLKVVPVQHHHAHIAACAAEHGITEDVLGVAFDGLGYGTDGSLWGGEFLVCGQGRFTRVAHLQTVPLVGGKTAMREPWRMALSYLNGYAEQDWFVNSLKDHIDRGKLAAVLNLVRSPATAMGLSSATSSCGRLFDAVAAVAGIRRRSSYEGQAAMEVEAGARRAQSEPADIFQVELATASPVIGSNQLVVQAARQRSAGLAPEAVAWQFHLSLADLVVRQAVSLCRQFGLGTVCLGGGCFQNMLLLNLVKDQLSNHGLPVLISEKLPCNDGGISLGQAVIAGLKE
jgi:hydrogenase maturation protein HypF